MEADELIRFEPRDFSLSFSPDCPCGPWADRLFETVPARYFNVEYVPLWPWNKRKRIVIYYNARPSFACEFYQPGEAFRMPREVKHWRGKPGHFRVTSGPHIVSDEAHAA